MGEVLAVLGWGFLGAAGSLAVGLACRAARRAAGAAAEGLASPPESLLPLPGDGDLARLRAENARLRAENARLRAALEPLAAAWRPAGLDRHHYLVENGKLRRAAEALRGGGG